MKLYLVRHGETEHNRTGIGLGRSDVPLNHAGRRQAGLLRDRLAEVAFDAAFASPLVRAAETAKIVVGERVPVVRHPDLIELDVGETEGLPFPEMRERYVDFLEQWRGPEGHLAIMPGGERLADVDERVASFLADLGAPTDANVLIVSHNFVIKTLICRLLGIGIAHFHSFTVDLASLTTFDLTPSRSVAVTVNDTCHLGGLES